MIKISTLCHWLTTGHLSNDFVCCLSPFHVPSQPHTSPYGAETVIWVWCPLGLGGYFKGGWRGFLWSDTRVCMKG